MKTSYVWQITYDVGQHPIKVIADTIREADRAGRMFIANGRYSGADIVGIVKCDTVHIDNGLPGENETATPEAE